MSQSVTRWSYQGPDGEVAAIINAAHRDMPQKVVVDGIELEPSGGLIVTEMEPEIAPDSHETPRCGATWNSHDRVHFCNRKDGHRKKGHRCDCGRELPR